jgi:hypothetical protein
VDKLEGRYRHFKGGEYDVLMEALCSETHDKMVVYKSVQTGRIWTRSRDRWDELVTNPLDPTTKVPRFEKV